MTRSRNDSITANGWHDESASRFYIAKGLPPVQSRLRVGGHLGQPLHFLQSRFPFAARGTFAQSRRAEGNADVVAARGGIDA